MPRFDDRGNEIRAGTFPFPRVHLVNAVLLAGIWIWSWSVYPDLPAEIPGHIGPGGRVRWDATTIRSWFALPLVVTGITVLHYALIPWIKRTNRFNLPSSVPFTELLPGDQAEVRTLTIRFLMWLNALLLVGFWLIQAGNRELALNPDAGIGPTTGIGIGFLIIAPTIASLAFLVYVTRAVADAERRARQQAAGEGR